ncbi:TPA: succinylglutamate-semialdehyde dehydrogenase [Photobacterium damselae]
MSQWIAGQWIAGQGETHISLNPYTEQAIWQGNEATYEQVHQAIEAARVAWLTWRNRDFSERRAYVERFAQLITEHQEQLAYTIAEETGKPLWETKTEVSAMVGKAAISVRAYQERTGLSRQQQGNNTMVLRHRPLGVMAVFGPYNFPGHLPNGHIIPALLAGNTVVFKPSDLTPKTAEVTMKLWQQAGLPDGVINLVQGGRATGEALAQSPLIDGLLFTGSAQTGHLLHQQLAGQPEKMLALEMGGNNPLIVTDQCSDDINATVYTIVQSAFLSAGQRCTCARRLYLPIGDKGDALLEQLVNVTQQLHVGDPFSAEQPFMGPQISSGAADKILSAQAYLATLGAEVLLAAKRGKGAIITPAILDVSKLVTLPDEEYFGPLLQVIRYSSFEQAVELANQTRYGLSAGLISLDDGQWDYFVANIRAGIVNRNRPLTGASGSAPFGGLGASGNLRPSAYYAADYCAYPMASVEGDDVELPEQLLPGIVLP